MLYNENKFFDNSENAEKVFIDYVEDLNLSPKDFDKKILDLGSGSSKFAKWAKDNHVSDQIVSLDLLRQHQEKTKGVVGVIDALPFKDESFELVLSRCFFPIVSFSDKKFNQISRGFLEILRVLKEDGEVRLYPVREADAKNFDMFLEKLKQYNKISSFEKIGKMRSSYNIKKRQPAEYLEYLYIIKR